MTTLVTGAAGFIGMHLALRLARDGADVVGVDNSTRTTTSR
jgi:UDP-glucuronate 4-epimerase